MSRVIPKKLGTIEGIGRGQTAVLRVPNGPTYQQLIFESNIPPEEISRFTVNVGGVHNHGEIVEITGEEAIMLDKYKGFYVPVLNNHKHRYCIAFGAPEGKTDTGQLYSGLVTLPSDNITIGIEFKSVGSAVLPVIRSLSDNALKYAIITLN